MEKDVLPYLLDKPFASIEDVKKILPIEDVQVETDERLIEDKLFKGYLVLKAKNEKEKGCFAFIDAKETLVRSLSPLRSKRLLLAQKKHLLNRSIKTSTF
ncbi:hypothetical protein [Bacillus sp. PK3_68]|uniref:hypothetical protein n=1 Tax=Bacillus sp. PK3_68 TaxID=2027408 RepID=UPI0026D82ACF